MGILFALYGVTNTGKTTQQKLLEERLRAEGRRVAYVKYPVYDLAPTGPRINAYLRQGNPEGISPREFHELQIQNKKDFAPELDRLLAENAVVLAEMYTGTGIAYGMGDGMDKEWLLTEYAALRQPDVALLLDGARFLESREAGHHYEEDDEKTERIRLAHLELARELGWDVLRADRSIPEVHEDIHARVAAKLA